MGVSVFVLLKNHHADVIQAEMLNDEVMVCSFSTFRQVTFADFLPHSTFTPVKRLGFLWV